MGTANVLAMMLFQGGDGASSGQINWLLVFVGVIAFCSFVQFLVLVGAGIAALKVYKSVSAEINVLKGKAMPIVASVQGVVSDIRPKINAVSAKVQEIVEDSTPKVKAITTKVQEIVEDATPHVKVVTANVADISTVAKNKVHDFEQTLDKANQTVRDANDRTRAQVDKVDGMVSSALKATSDVGNTIHRGIRMPVMEVAGVVNAMKAALDVLVGREKSPARSSASARSTSAPPTQSPSSSSHASSTAGVYGESRGAAGAIGRAYGSPGPVPVPSSETATSSHPSSNVAPSPGAEEVVERFRNNEKIKTIY